MKVDIFSFFCIGLLGTLLLYSYYYYVTTNKKNADKLWGSINSYLKTFYIYFYVLICYWIFNIIKLFI